MRKYEINIWHDGQGFTDTRYASVENDLKPVSFYISISNDGHGFYLFSNETRYSSIENAGGDLPKGTEVTLINDKLIEESD